MKIIEAKVARRTAGVFRIKSSGLATHGGRVSFLGNRFDKHPRACPRGTERALKRLARDPTFPGDSLSAREVDVGYRGNKGTPLFERDASIFRFRSR